VVATKCEEEALCEKQYVRRRKKEKETPKKQELSAGTDSKHGFKTKVIGIFLTAKDPKSLGGAAQRFWGRKGEAGEEFDCSISRKRKGGSLNA